MKIYYNYIIGVILVAFMIIACSDDNNERLDSLQGFSLSKTYLTIPEDGGDVTLTINSATAWKLDSAVVVGKHVDTNGKTVSDYDRLPKWLNATPVTGKAGQTTITFHANASNSGREILLRLSTGNHKQYIIVRQGSFEAATATCADIIAGVDGKTYRVKGLCTSIVNNTNGNWYLNDGTGEIYIYGTLDAKGIEKNFSSLDIEPGDMVEVEGPKTTYKGTVELINVSVLKITKSLIKVVSTVPEIDKGGGKFTIKAAYKGKSTLVDIPEQFNWISLLKIDYIQGIPTKIEINPSDTVVYNFKVAPNTEGNRIGYVTISSTLGKNTSSINVSVTQAGTD